MTTGYLNVHTRKSQGGHSATLLKDLPAQPRMAEDPPEQAVLGAESHVLVFIQCTQIIAFKYVGHVMKPSTVVERDGEAIKAPLIDHL